MTLEIPTDKNPPPTVVAGLAGLVCLPVVFFSLKPLAIFPHLHRHAELPGWTLIPIAVVFAVLYRSSWHREFSRGRRIVSAVCLSCVIYCINWLVAAVIIMGGFVIIGLLPTMAGY